MGLTEKQLFASTMGFQGMPPKAKAKKEKAPKEKKPKAEGEKKKGKKEAPQRELLHLHLQGAQAGPSRHGHFVQGNKHYELLHHRHLRQDRERGRQACALQQEGIDTGFFRETPGFSQNPQP